MQNYFEIENVDCSYEKTTNNPKVVLEIKKLQIPRGKIVFIVGQSGCGKSTILETLGLMNNTVVNNTVGAKFLFKPDENKEIDCLTVWQKKNQVLSDIRKKYFSFIFQQTNLMHNFSIKENATISQLIKGGNKKYKDTLQQIGLEQILNEKKEKVGELSGGQQQRLAFVRAFMPNFNIIFGDEPTGNLDPENADNLIKIIADEIHTSDKNKTAIIVSHSPELSSKYADIIIKIHKKERNKNETYGVIDQSSVFEKRDEHWHFENRTLSESELQNKIKS